MLDGGRLGVFQHKMRIYSLYNRSMLSDSTICRLAELANLSHDETTDFVMVADVCQGAGGLTSTCAVTVPDFSDLYWHVHVGSH